MTKLELNGPFKSSGNIPAKHRSDLSVGIKPNGDVVVLTGTRPDLLVFESEGGTLWVVDDEGKTRNGHPRITNGQALKPVIRSFTTGEPPAEATFKQAYGVDLTGEDAPEWKDRIMTAVQTAYRTGQLITLYALVAAARIPTSPPDTTVKHWIERLGDTQTRTHNLTPYLFSQKPLAFGRDGIK